MDSLAQIIGKRLRIARKMAGLSQEQLAELAAMHPTYIGQLERGEKNATLESVHRIALALQLPLSQLFEHIDENPGQERSLARDCYDYVLSLPLEKQQQFMTILINIDRFRS